MWERPTDADGRDEQVAGRIWLSEVWIELHGKVCHGLLQHGSIRAAVLILAWLPLSGKRIAGERRFGCKNWKKVNQMVKTGASVVVPVGLGVFGNLLILNWIVVRNSTGLTFSVRTEGFRSHGLKQHVEKVTRLTFNNDLYGAEPPSVWSFTIVSSRVLSDSLFHQDGLILVQWIKQAYSICCVFFKINRHPPNTILRLFEPECVGSDFAAGWQSAWQVHIRTLVYFHGKIKWDCRGRDRNRENTSESAPFEFKPFVVIFFTCSFSKLKSKFSGSFQCKPNRQCTQDKQRCVSHQQLQCCMSSLSQCCFPSPHKRTRPCWQDLQGIWTDTNHPF